MHTALDVRALRLSSKAPSGRYLLGTKPGCARTVGITALVIGVILMSASDGTVNVLSVATGILSAMTLPVPAGGSDANGNVR